jgi:TRAP-type C4-dicarboxylate transport system substrate-binding protein
MQLTNKIRPIKTAKDMQGIKFRTMTLPSHIAFFDALGASAVPVSWAETYTALQTGVVDGQQNPIGYIISGNIYEVQKYLTMTNHLFTTHWFIVNDDFLKSLSEENRKIFYDAARVATVASRGITRIAQATGKGMPLLMKNLQVYQPTAAELQTFSAICIPASRKFVKEKMGDTIAALQDDMLKAIEESKKKLGY